MKTLKDILYKVSLVSTHGSTEVKVSGLAFDSRLVGPGFAFVAVAGTQTDGHEFINLAIEKGAVCIICERLPETLNDSIVYIQTNSSADALGILASNWFGNPSEKLNLIGVTGTNGKTTTTTILYQLFMALGLKTGLISTVEYRVDEKIYPSTHTTPDALKLNALLAEMVKAGCTHCFMEVSSHAVVQRRIAGLAFKGGVFTNLSHDHLDFHHTFDNYIQAKKLFFDGLKADAFALVNVDDRRGKVMVQNTKARIFTYSLETGANFHARILANSIQGLQLELDGNEIWCKLIGNFNAYNLLAAYAVAILMEENKEEVLLQLSAIDPVGGRFERYISRNKVLAIVDYAHTPDALKNVLETINQMRTGNENLITVVGCGGNRDKEKRPLMAEIACKLSNTVVLTSDNPRNEEPEEIIEDMRKGVSPSNYKKVKVITDRKEAISWAYAQARPADIILVAGKGHENYQEIKGVKYPFDDRKIIVEQFNRESN